MNILLVTPPMTQLNTPYPGTAYLTAFLREQGYRCKQADPAMDLFLRLFSADGLREIEAVARQNAEQRGEITESVAWFFEHSDECIRIVDRVIRFLQGRDDTLAVRLAQRALVPEGPRFAALEEQDLDWAFGAVGVQDLAKWIATLFVDHLADVIRDGVDERFALAKYGDRLAESQPSFDPLYEALNGEETLLDEYIRDIARELLFDFSPDVIGLSVPFPGNVYGALRMADEIRRFAPQTTIVMGGGYPNTELRQLSDPRVFDWVDYITLDDGEAPFVALLDRLRSGSGALKRTFYREGERVVFADESDLHDVPLSAQPAPTYDGLDLDRYVSLLEMPNPMHRLWSDGHWNKLTVAHGCYWAKCTFCDVTLDYIGRYDPAEADVLVDRIEKLIDETGRTGFHFVDEAAPPAKLRNLSQRLIERDVVCSWWGNIRFEKTFTPELAELMAESGCIAVTGGLEVASERLLKLIDKGVSIEQVARVTRGFSDAGILVHAYLMYGFPTQTVQETVDSLEVVRQLFINGCIHSAFWHRLAVTTHSPIAKDPDRFGVTVHPPFETPPEHGVFSINDLPFDDPTGVDHDVLGDGLRTALFNYMHGVGLDEDVRFWFADDVPATTEDPERVERALGV